jgi:hypothetical protein
MENKVLRKLFPITLYTTNKFTEYNEKIENQSENVLTAERASSQVRIQTNWNCVRHALSIYTNIAQENPKFTLYYISPKIWSLGNSRE